MKHKHIRLFGALLASMMAVTTLPVSSLAAEPAEVVPAAEAVEIVEEIVTHTQDAEVPAGVTAIMAEEEAVVTEPSLEGEVGPFALKPVPAEVLDTWKVRTEEGNAYPAFTAQTATQFHNTFTFYYQNAGTGADEYISAVVYENYDITYYGRILKPAAASGFGTIVVSDAILADITNNEASLHLFAEKYAGDYQTQQFSSDIQLTAELPEYYSYPVSGTVKASKLIADGVKSTVPLVLTGDTVLQLDTDLTVADVSEVVLTSDGYDLTIEGGGVLNAGDIWTHNLTIKDGAVIVSGALEIGIEALGTVTINDAAVTVNQGDLYAEKDLIVSGGSVAVKQGQLRGGNISVKGGAVSVTEGILAWNSLQVTAPSEITTPAGGQIKRLKTSDGDNYYTVTDTTGVMAAKVVIGTGNSTGNSALPDMKGTASADGVTDSVAGAKAAQAGSWKGNARKGYWYSYQSGSYPKSTIAVINNAYYYFDKNGYMKTGWQKIGGKYYFFNKNGQMQVGWLKSGKKWYYLNPKTGVMMTGWVKIGGKWYLLGKSGAMLTGWQKSGKKWYYMNKNGVMQTGWKKIGGDWYYMDKKSGAMKTGWLKSGGKWYYLDSKGVMVTNTSRKIGKKTYRFDKNGVCTNS